MIRNHLIEQMKQERIKLTQEREKLLKEVDILNGKIALIDKFSATGNEAPTLPLVKLAPEVMKAMKRFSRRELADRIKQEHPTVQFSEHSLSKPLSIAIKGGTVKMVKPNIGSKQQAIYEWIKE